MAYWLTRILTLSFVVAGGHMVFLATRALLTGADVPGGLPSHLSIEWALFYLMVATMAYLAWFINFGNGETQGRMLRAILVVLAIAAVVITLVGLLPVLGDWKEEIVATGAGWAVLLGLYIYGVCARIIRIRARRVRAAGDEKLVEVVVEALNDRHYFVRWTAAKVLSELGATASVAVPALTLAQSDRVRRVRTAASAALHRITNATTSALPIEEVTLRAENPYAPPSTTSGGLTI